MQEPVAFVEVLELLFISGLMVRDRPGWPLGSLGKAFMLVGFVLHLLVHSGTRFFLRVGFIWKLRKRLMNLTNSSSWSHSYSRLAAGCLLLGLGRTDEFAKKLSYFAFGFPCLAGILLFLRFDESVNGYNFVLLYSRMGLQELKINFHLGLNGVSSPLFAMAGIVGFGAGLAAIGSGVERLRLYLALLLFMQSGLMGLFASVDLFFYYLFHEFAFDPNLWLDLGRTRSSQYCWNHRLPYIGSFGFFGGLVALNVMVDSKA